MSTATLGPQDGTVEIHTHREGMAQKAGHDLIIDVGAWSATVDMAAGGGLDSVNFEVDASSLQVREGRNGIKPLSEKDRGEILKNIARKILHDKPIRFRSTGTDGPTISGELTIDGTTRPATFTLDVTPGRVRGTLTVTQTEFGITPYRALMGALKVRDEVEVVLDVTLPG